MSLPQRPELHLVWTTGAGVAPGGVWTVMTWAAHGRVQSTPQGPDLHLEVSTQFRGLWCNRTCLYCIGLCCSWSCLWAAPRTCLNNRSLCCFWIYLHSRGLCCTQTWYPAEVLCCSCRCLHHNTGAWAAPGRLWTTLAFAAPEPWLIHYRGLCCLGLGRISTLSKH